MKAVSEILNLKVGLLRIWVVISVLFAITVAYYRFPAIRDEFVAADYVHGVTVATSYSYSENLIPVDCSQARRKYLVPKPPPGYTACEVVPTYGLKVGDLPPRAAIDSSATENAALPAVTSDPSFSKDEYSIPIPPGATDVPETGGGGAFSAGEDCRRSSYNLLNHSDIFDQVAAENAVTGETKPRNPKADALLCWYPISEFRTLYPAYLKTSDNALVRKMYKKVGLFDQLVFDDVHAPWTMLLRTAAFAAAVPLVILALGSAVFWALAGFKRRQDP